MEKRYEILKTKFGPLTIAMYGKGIPYKVTESRQEGVYMMSFKIYIENKLQQEFIEGFIAGTNA